MVPLYAPVIKKSLRNGLERGHGIKKTLQNTYKGLKKGGKQDFNKQPIAFASHPSTGGEAIYKKRCRIGAD